MSDQGSRLQTSMDAHGRHIVERLGGHWHPQGGMCRCPAHDDGTPSLSVRPGHSRLLFHCFAGCEARDILRSLGSAGILGDRQPPQQEDAERQPGSPGHAHRGAATRLWSDSRPIGRSPAERYLSRRGLLRPAADLRYHPRTPYGRGAQALFRPAMLAAVRDDSGLVAVHRTFVDISTGCLAGLETPKRALGRLGRGAVRLFPPRSGVLGWAEGIENAIAATQLTDIPCWATLGTERFAHVALPAAVQRLVLFLDNDAGGRRAEMLAREAHLGSALIIETRYPEAEGADWNDILVAGRSG